MNIQLSASKPKALCEKGHSPNTFLLDAPARRPGRGVHRLAPLRAFVRVAAWDISKRVQAACIDLTQQNRGLAL